MIAFRSITLLIVMSGLVMAEETWPQFRGPDGKGVSNSKKIATKWSEAEGIRWAVPIHDKGWSSPVVWGNQIWLTTAKEDGKEMFAICIDRETGKVVHDLKLFTHEKPADYTKYNSYASPTPVIEEGRVYITFGSFGTACLDSKTGEILWKRTDLPCEHWRGAGSSPILFKDLFILHYDGYDYQYVVALNKATGETVWKTDRTVEYGTTDGDVMKAFCTPIVIEAAGKTQLISPTSKAAQSFDPATGKEFWRVRFTSFSATAMPIYANGKVFINTGFGKADLLAVRPDGEGDVTMTHVDWVAKKQVPSKPSPVLSGDLIFMVHDEGIASCLDAKTGDERWTRRLGGKFTASPLIANGNVYFMDEDGVATVAVATGEKFQEVAVNKLPKGCKASPAVAGDDLLIRTMDTLYSIKGN